MLALGLSAFAQAQRGSGGKPSDLDILLGQITNTLSQANVLNRQTVFPDCVLVRTYDVDLDYTC